MDGLRSLTYNSSTRSFSGRHKTGYAYIPLAGQISNSNGALKDVGTCGYYWIAGFWAYTSYYSYGYLLDQYYVSSTDMLISMGASVRCQKDDSGAKVDFKSAVDLSRSGTETANSYIVSKAGVYTIPTVKGNTTESVGEVKSVEVMWESLGNEGGTKQGDIIKGVKFEDGKVYFWTQAPFTEGNALIAAKDASGTVLWSWHIWVTDEPKQEIYPNGAGIMMDRNLGATNTNVWYSETQGLLYQWGRKDPFVGMGVDMWEPIGVSKSFSSTFVSYDTGTIDYTIKNPTTWIGGYDVEGETNDWCFEDETGTRWQSQKTIYDPCPAGWRVPDGGPDGVWAKSQLNLNSYEETRWAVTLYADDFAAIYPAASSWMGHGFSYNYPSNYATYWSCTPADNGTAHGLFVEMPTLIQENASRPRIDAYSVRCVME
jgi:hypothetical protein